MGNGGREEGEDNMRRGEEKKGQEEEQQNKKYELLDHLTLNVNYVVCFRIISRLLMLLPDQIFLQMY